MENKYLKTLVKVGTINFTILFATTFKCLTKTNDFLLNYFYCTFYRTLEEYTIASTAAVVPRCMSFQKIMKRMIELFIQWRSVYSKSIV